MKGIFVANKYYNDAGMDFVFDSLFSEFSALNVELKRCSPSLSYCGKQICIDGINQPDFAIFWDKNIYLAQRLEDLGIRVFNSSKAVATCDDKELTYQKLNGVLIPKTVSVPKMYDNCQETDHEFLDYTINCLGFPMVVKENVGSQGRQVFLAKNRHQLEQIYAKLKHTNHHYQQFVGEFGTDIRFYVVGGKLTACYKRKGTGFKSNLYDNGVALAFEPNEQMKAQAIEIINRLELDFGAADFLISEDKLIFLEANASAYFSGAHKLGFFVARAIANHIKTTLGESNGRK